MGARLDRVLVVDVECTCWDIPKEQYTKPQEIIEIGICELITKTGDIVHADSFVVKPRFSEVSEFCTRLTGWTQADVDKGMDIEDALKTVMVEYSVTNEDTWFSCGEFDRRKLAHTGPVGVGILYGIHPRNNPFAQMRSHFNIKTLFALKHQLRKELALDRMLQFFGAEFEGIPHNGRDDAVNIAKVVRHVLHGT